MKAVIPPKTPISRATLNAALQKVAPALSAELDECTRQMREVQARLGKGDMRPGDVELARELGHKYMNLIHPFLLGGEEDQKIDGTGLERAVS